MLAAHMPVSQVENQQPVREKDLELPRRGVAAEAEGPARPAAARAGAGQAAVLVEPGAAREPEVSAPARGVRGAAVMAPDEEMEPVMATAADREVVRAAVLAMDHSPASRLSAEKAAEWWERRAHRDPIPHPTTTSPASLPRAPAAAG